VTDTASHARSSQQTSDVLAEVEIYHSRSHSPTRRIALGHLILPVEPAPGVGGVLLAAMLASHLPQIDEDLVPDVHRLLQQVDRADRVVQPRLRHRYQIDRHGLSRTTHRLVGDGNEFRYEIDGNGTAVQHVLGAIYCLERLEVLARHAVAPALQKAMRWRGPIDATFLSYLVGGAGSTMASVVDPRAWALELLGFPAGTVRPSKRDVQRRYRDSLREAHPDHGGDVALASGRIEQLGEARRVLLASLT
jgi:hypothetical protein